MNKNKCDCKQQEICGYEYSFCRKCGVIKEHISEGLNKGWKLKIENCNGEIIIRGNKEGLEYLAECCLKIIGKEDPAGHVHLQWQMGNLLEGSIETRLEYTDKDEDYE